MLYFASTSGYTFAKFSKVTLYKVPTQIPNQYFTGRVRGEISGHQETLKDVEIQVGARITTKRSYGNIPRFYNVKAEGVSMQIMCELKKATGTPFVEQHEHLRRDWIGVVGFPGRTQSKSRDSGELSKTFMSLNISQKQWLNKYRYFCSGGVPPHTLPASGTHV